MKMCQFYTAYYGDHRAAYKKPLDWIYQNQGETSVEIRPTIWVWAAENSHTFFVDYVGAGVGCTLSAFDKYADALKFAEYIGSMEESIFEDWLINVRWKQTI